MQESPQMQKIALAVTRWIGSVQSIIIHTIVFAASFCISLFGLIPFDRMLLILTTILSLEAIYLALFIQMTVNINTTSIEEVSEDIEEIQVDMGEIQEDVEELQEDVEEISEDVEEITEDESDEEKRHREHEATLSTIQADLRKLMSDIERLKSN